MGTHLDSPKHVLKNGIGIDQIDIEKCSGKCQVINLTSIPFGEKINSTHLKSHPIKENEIILFKTKNSSILNKEYNPDYIELGIEGAKYLVDMKIKAVGIDYLSIGSHEVHEILLKEKILVYEMVNLSNIKPGDYYFMGLPLKIPTEGCPVRAILIEELKYI